MTKPWWKNPLVLSLTALFLTVTGIIVFSVLAIARAVTPARTDRPLSADEIASIDAARGLMRSQGLSQQADQATQIEQEHLWRAAVPGDTYIKQSEQAGDTPFAYTLSSGHRPSAIVLAPRFFTDTTPAARAALMMHEMGHYQAYVKTGHSDEFDGYKAEYDTHKQLGLTDTDGLTYFAMLDGVVEYVAPRLPVYKTYPDVKAYINEGNNS